MHDEHDEVDMDAYFKDAVKRADWGEYWPLWGLLPVLVVLVFCGLFFEWRGLGFVVIWGIVVLLLQLVEIRSLLFVVIVLGGGILATLIYLVLAYQTV